MKLSLVRRRQTVAPLPQGCVNHPSSAGLHADQSFADADFLTEKLILPKSLKRRLLKQKERLSKLWQKRASHQSNRMNM